MTLLQPQQAQLRSAFDRGHAEQWWGWRLWVGWSAVAFSVVYWLSDVVEVVQGDFSTLRLCLTYAGEAAIPLFVLGLYAVQRPRIGGLGLFGAVAYAYSYVFFTTTVMYALIAGTPNYRALANVFGVWMTVHGLVMLLGGLAFGLAVIRTDVLPGWTGIALVVGVILVAAASGLPNLARTIAATLPAAAFTGMGSALIIHARTARTAISAEDARHLPRRTG
jgi:hypothetical protein